MMNRTTNVLVVSMLPFRKSGGETINLACNMKAWLSPSQYFKPKSPILSSQAWFSSGEDDPDYTAPSFWDFKWRQRRKDDSPDIASADLFLFPRAKW
jgi:hypothetical protein